MIRRILLLALALAFCSRPLAAQTTTLSGRLTASNFQAITGATVTLGLSQAGVQPGSNNLAAQTVSCYTAASNGAVVGVPDPQIAPTVSLTAGSLGAGTYYVFITYYYGAGETLPSPYATIVLAAPGGIQITSPTLQPTPGTGYNVYIGTTSANATQQIHNLGFATSSQTTTLVGGVALPTSNTTTCVLAANDSIIPSYTTYHVNVLDKSGNQVAGFPQDWYLVSGTLDITQQLPIAVNVRVRFPQPIIANPNSAAVQSVNSPLTLNQYGLTAGDLVLPINASPPTPSPLPGSGYSVIYTDSSNNLNLCSGLGTCWQVGQTSFNVQTLNNVQKCDQYVGANAGTKISAAIAAVPSTGGTVDCTGLQGAQSIPTDVFHSVTKEIQLIFGAATYTFGSNTTFPFNINVRGVAGTILDPGTTLTFNGLLEGEITFGAGTVTYGSSTVNFANTEIFGLGSVVDTFNAGFYSQQTNTFGFGTDSTSNAFLTLKGNTVTADQPMIYATETWNNAAVSFNGIFLNVTNTASNVGSKLMDLQLGGSSKWNVTEGGATQQAGSLTITSGGETITAGNLLLSSGNETLTSGNLTLTLGALNLANGNIVQTSGAITVNGGANIVYRCATAGNDRAGVLTIVAGDCGSTQDTGLRVP